MTRHGRSLQPLCYALRTMFRHLRIFSAVLSPALLVPLLLHAQQPQAEVKYLGTVGQQHVTMLLDVEGGSVHGGHYAYDAQKSDIRIVDSRVFGTTVVLQDEDGNILHLHFKDARGEGAADWKAASGLEGTLSRGDLDLPVKLARQALTPAKPSDAR